MSRVTVDRPVVQVRDGVRRRRPDVLVAEEPLELRVGDRPLAVTMRTPGADFDLAAGFLVSEGVVHRRDQLAALRYCEGKAEAPDGSGRQVNTYNVLRAVLAPGTELPEVGLERNFTTTSACGVCGKASIDAIRTEARWSVADDPVVLDPAVLEQLPERMRARQQVFERTGGLHAAGLFTADGELLCLREDVGRHNAVDKVVGWALRQGRLPLRGTVLLVSGRASFELTQKALMAGIPALAAVSAPSSLAVDLAAPAGLTLVGFLRGGSMNVYAGVDRVA